MAVFALYELFISKYNYDILYVQFLKYNLSNIVNNGIIMTVIKLGSKRKI